MKLIKTFGRLTFAGQKETGAMRGEPQININVVKGG